MKTTERSSLPRHRLLGRADRLFFQREYPITSAGQSSQGPPSNPPTTITFSLANATPDEETGTGTLRLVLQHVWQYNTSESFPPYVASNEITQSITRSYRERHHSLQFSSISHDDGRRLSSWRIPGYSPICASYSGYAALLVYQGPLGGEADSVIVANCREWGCPHIV